MHSNHQEVALNKHEKLSRSSSAIVALQARSRFLDYKTDGEIHRQWVDALDGDDGVGRTKLGFGPRCKRPKYSGLRFYDVGKIGPWLLHHRTSNPNKMMIMSMDNDITGQVVQRRRRWVGSWSH
jgi:hypothetical protein